MEIQPSGDYPVPIRFEGDISVEDADKWMEVFDAWLPVLERKGWTEGVACLRVGEDFPWWPTLITIWGQYISYSREILLNSLSLEGHNYDSGGWDRTLIHEFAHHVHLTDMFGDSTKYDERAWEKRIQIIDEHARFSKPFDGDVGSEITQTFSRNACQNRLEFVANYAAFKLVNGTPTSNALDSLYKSYGGPDLW